MLPAVARRTAHALALVEAMVPTLGAFFPRGGPVQDPVLTALTAHTRNPAPSRAAAEQREKRRRVPQTGKPQNSREKSFELFDVNLKTSLIRIGGPKSFESQTVQRTFAWKPRPESGLNCLICDTFARQRTPRVSTRVDSRAADL